MRPERRSGRSFVLPRVEKNSDTAFLVFFFLICLTDSMDTFLNLSIGGFSLRAVLVLFICAAALLVFRIFVKNRGNVSGKIHGGTFLLLWMCFLAFFIPFSTL